MTENERKFTGVFIPAEIYEREDVTWTEKILWCEICALAGSGVCYASNEYFAEKYKTTPAVIRHRISKLKQLGMIEQVGFDGRTRHLRPCYIVNKTEQNTGREDNKVLSEGTKKYPQTVLKSTPSIYKDEIKDEIKEETDIKTANNFDYNNRDIFTQMLPNDLLQAIKVHVVPVLWGYFYRGEPPTEEQLITYIQHRVGNRWKKESGKPINNIALDLAEWLKNEKTHPRALNDKDVEVFIAAWNERVYKSLKSVSVWTDVIEATMDNSKDRFATAKAELTKLIAEVKKKQAEGKKPFLGINVPFDNIWVFATEIFCKRRFYSTFLYDECKTTPAFFLKNIKTLADPYSDEYLDDSQKWYHD